MNKKQNEQKTAVKVEPKQEVKPITKVEPKVEQKPVVKTEAKQDVKPVVKVEPKVDPKKEAIKKSFLEEAEEIIPRIDEETLNIEDDFSFDE